MAYYVCMTDSFMSGWGDAAGKTNVFVVECETAAQADMIEQAAHRRPEMKRVRVNISPPRPRPHWLISWRKFADMGGPWVEEMGT